jgi:hypothetical protein
MDLILNVALGVMLLLLFFFFLVTTFVLFNEAMTCFKDGELFAGIVSLALVLFLLCFSVAIGATGLMFITP